MSTHKQKIKANIWKYSLFNLLRGLCFYLPFIVYYIQGMGYNLAQLMIILGASQLSIFLFEIPTGYIADKIGRKKSIMIGIFFHILSILTLIYAKSLGLLILAHVFLGICDSFISGADSALLYDSLIELKKEKQFKKYEGKAKFFYEIAVIAAALIGSVIVKFGLVYTIVATLIINIIILFFILSFYEPKIHIPIKKLKLKGHLKEMFKSIKYTLKKPQLIFISIYSILVFALMNIIFRAYQPYFREVNLSLPLYGVMFALFSGFAAITALYAHKIEHKLGIKWSLIIMPLLLTIAFIGGGAVFLKIGIVFFFIRELVRGFIYPVIGDYVNKMTNSAQRATIISIQSMFTRLGFVIISFIFGVVGDALSLKTALIIFGGLAFLVTIITLFTLRKNSYLMNFKID